MLGRATAFDPKQQALRLIALSFFTLAGYVVVEAVRDLIVGAEAEESVVGIVLAAVSLVVMPALAIAKRHTAKRMNSATLARRRFGGVTGDVLGVAEQLTEISVLLLGAAAVANGWPSLAWWR